MGPVLDGMYCCEEIGTNGVTLAEVKACFLIWVVLHEWRMVAHIIMHLNSVCCTVLHLVLDCLKFLHDGV